MCTLSSRRGRREGGRDGLVPIVMVMGPIVHFGGVGRGVVMTAVAPLRISLQAPFSERGILVISATGLSDNISSKVRAPLCTSVRIPFGKRQIISWFCGDTTYTVLWESDGW